MEVSQNSEMVEGVGTWVGGILQQLDQSSKTLTNKRSLFLIFQWPHGILRGIVVSTAFSNEYISPVVTCKKINIQNPTNTLK